MADIYYKTFRVPLWAIVGGSEEVVTRTSKWLDAAEARRQDWPTKGFWKHLFTYKDKYPDYFTEEGKVSRPSFDFMARASSEYLKAFMDIHSSLVIPHGAHHVDRNLNTEQDAVVWLDTVINMLPDLQLSQLFQVVKYCYREDSPKYKLWYTEAPCGVDTIQKICDKVITIGDDPRADIDLTGLKGKKIEQKLEESFSIIMQQGVKK